MDNQKTHVVEKEFFEIFLLHTFRLIGPQTKLGNMQPCTAKVGLKSSVVYTVHVLVQGGSGSRKIILDPERLFWILKDYSGSGYDEAKNSGYDQIRIWI